MDAERLQVIAERDQLWASLRALRPEIKRLAEGELDLSDQKRHLVMLLARIVAAEMDFREKDASMP